MLKKCAFLLTRNIKKLLNNANNKLPDGKELVFNKKVSGFEISEKISKSLSKQALVMSVNGQQKDLSEKIENDSSVKIFTSRIRKV